MRFLLDTNILSQPVKKTPKQKILERWRLYADEVATAAPVWNELSFGYRRLPPSKRRDSFRRYIEGVLKPSLPILAYDAAAAEWHAKERARLEALGKRPAFVDGQIAAIARTQDLVLVTLNVKDFIDFEELMVESWTQDSGSP